jgi:hypothetical protein
MPKSRKSSVSTHTLCPYCSTAVKVAGGGLSNHFFHHASCRRKRDNTGTLATATRNLDSSGLTSNHLEDTDNSHLRSGVAPNMETSEDHIGMESEGRTHSGEEGRTVGSGTRPDLHIPSAKDFIVREDSDAGHCYRNREPTCYESLKSSEDPANPSAPWASEDEWELAKWLMTVHISQATVDRFLRLDWVCTK